MIGPVIAVHSDARALCGATMADSDRVHELHSAPSLSVEDLEAMHDEPTQPYKPKRRRWPWVLLALALVAAGTFGIVRYTLHRRVVVELARIRTAGYPTTLAELDAWYPTPTGANAADVYLEAFDAYVRDEELEMLLPGFRADVDWPAPDEPIPAEMLAADFPRPPE